jgi:MOB kinase activator 1
MEQKRNKQPDGYRCLNNHMFSGTALIQQVLLPSGKSVAEWVAMNFVAFYNDVSTIWDVIKDDPSLITFGPGEGFPPNVQYRWMEGFGEDIKYISVSSPVYIATVLKWIEGQINSIFSGDCNSAAAVSFLSPDFGLLCWQIFRRLYRVYAIIYWQVIYSCSHSL